MKPRLKLPSLPRAVRPGPEAACGEARVRGPRGRPGPASRRSSPPSAASPQPPCRRRVSPRGDTETEEGIPGESRSRHYQLLPQLRLTFKPRQNGAAAKAATTAHVRARPRRGAGQKCFWPHPGWKDQSEP